MKQLSRLSCACLLMVPFLLGTPAAAGSCKSTLAHLADELPYFSEPTLADLRRQVLAMNVKEIWENYRAPASMARKAIEQSIATQETSLKYAEEAIRKVAVDPDKVFRELADGTFRFGSSMTSDYARSYVMAQYQLVANREAAIILACLTADK